MNLYEKPELKSGDPEG